MRARGETYLQGDLGVWAATAFPGSAGEVTYVVVTLEGGLSPTTVMPGGEAVHSRHATVGGALDASQHRRGCE